MGEHTQIFENGTWVKGETTEGENFDFGVVVGFDEGDGEHSVSREPDSLVDLTNGDLEAWCRPDDIETTDPPAWVGGGGSEHVFVIDWLDDGVPNSAIFATPEALVAKLSGGDGPANPGLGPDDLNKLERQLLECVADPGERFIVAADIGVRFVAVEGNER